MSHTAELIAVGTELLLGNIATPTPDALPGPVGPGHQRLLPHGGGRQPPAAAGRGELAKSRADILITTGGLGPTCDDLTKNVLAECFGKKLVFHAPSARRIEATLSGSTPAAP